MTRTPTEVLAGAASASVWPPVMAVDPGGRWTGLCLRAGTLAVEAMTVPRLGSLDSHTATVEFAEQVVAEAEALLERRKRSLTRLAERWGLEPQPVRWCVETFVAPSAWRGGKAATAIARHSNAAPVGVQVGMLVGRHSALLVPPHGDGGWDHLPDGSYPTTLTGRTPEGWKVLRDAKGRTPARSHQRAAWAQAGAAHLLYPTPEGQQVPTAPEKAVQRAEPDRAAEVAVVRALVEQSGQWTSHWRKPRVLIRVARTAAESLGVPLSDERLPTVVRAVAKAAKRDDGDALRDRVRAVLEKDLVA